MNQSVSRLDAGERRQLCDIIKGARGSVRSTSAAGVEEIIRLAIASATRPNGRRSNPSEPFHRRPCHDPKPALEMRLAGLFSE